MKAMVVYESEFGNTEQVAQAIAGAMREALGDEGEVEVQHVRDAQPEQLAGLDLLVVGSPTQKFSPMPATKQFLKSIPKNALAGVKVAAFDTRVTEEEFASHGRVVVMFVAIFGYAAEPIAKRLKKKGGEPAVAPEGFYVSGTEGPLLDGELERATGWGRLIVSQ
jgi:flavodoxin